MKVFVTGATGFIGQNTVRRLIESGHECICLVRGTSKKEVLENTGCQFVTGDITDKKSLIEGMKGCDAVVNLANLYSLWEPDMSLFKAINVYGMVISGGYHKSQKATLLLSVPRASKSMSIPAIIW